MVFLDSENYANWESKQIIHIEELNEAEGIKVSTQSGF